MKQALPQGAPIKSITYVPSPDNSVLFGKVLGSICRRTLANSGVNVTLLGDAVAQQIVRPTVFEQLFLYGGSAVSVLLNQ
jgi:hypothetical protein